MAISISHSTQIVKGEIQLASSKSLSNRALIIRALCEDDFEIENLSNSDDTVVLQRLLNSKEKELNVNLGGTTMRFLTAFLAIKEGETILTGAERMKERPIKILVDALKQIGADIEYVEKEGFPPLKITGKKLEGGKITINGSVSSQYISALLMVAPRLKNGLQINFEGEFVSKPYINMTIEMMRYFGASVRWEGNDHLIVEQGEYKAKNILIEADWSAASYWYGMVAFAKEADVTLLGLKEESLQGDALVQGIYKNFGVTTEFVEGGIRLTKNSEFRILNSELKIDFVNFPDITQTVAVTCAALNVQAKLTGLKTLRIKETDRIVALQSELNNLGFHVEVVGDDIIVNHISKEGCLLNRVEVKTYNDHRMAMAFAPLALLSEITIENENVVAKSYPNFWKDMESVGVEIN
ncbi:MAG: 3-phosphoshikimate 1-carboxyvinyltransferase [Flavobacteriales bacterium]|nr:3-phosphoshikimate 1-carboxyvinyltransferase [Flavobacteriales bacterium]